MNRVALLGLIALAALPAAANAQQDDAAARYFKLTTSVYHQPDGDTAADVNLRSGAGPHVVWLGVYRDNREVQQLRTGYEFSQDAGALHVVWSAQAATRAFLGGSITAQYGDAIYPIVGIGRTNLRPYYNLNFDPNDMVMLGLGTKCIPDTELSITHIRDDRLGTGQHVTHLYLHRQLANRRRFSIDLSSKRGANADNIAVSGVGVTLTYAWDSTFARVAYDQYANFGNQTQTRLSLGRTF